MNKSLYEHLLHYSNKVYPMHMPGHKQGRMGHLNNLYNIDVTEVDGTDNLYKPEGILKEALEKAAKTFGADKTYFLVNGSTVGLMAAITAVCDPNDTLIVARNSHRSVYDGLITTGVKPVYIYPKIHEKGIIGGIDPEEVKSLLEIHKEAKGIIITSPTYDGVVSHIQAIADIVHERNKVLIVDEAHGAHFGFHDAFPATALQCGADVVVQSTHKTLPALTQSSMLHVNGSRISVDKIEAALALYQTSSPSYPLMASLDNCRELLDQRGQNMFEQYVSRLMNLRDELKQLNHIELLGEELRGSCGIHHFDIGKLLFYCGQSTLSGTDVDKQLRTRYNIQIEMSTFSYLVAMTTIADHQEGFNLLLKALIGIDGKLKKRVDEVDIISSIEPSIELIPREAFFKDKVLVSFDDAVINKVCGSYIIPYPPGIPLVVPGEVITEDVYHQMKRYKKEGQEVIGIDNIKIIQE